MNTCEAKVLPFKDANGADVPGHAIISHYPDIERVVFEHFDSEARMTVEVVVHWSQWTQFAKKAPSRAHTIKAVILRDGRRINATTYSVTHHDAPAYYRAPILARGTFKISGLCSRDTLLEIAGVGAWAHSQRRPEDADLILDPWARDNAEFDARMAGAAA